MIIRYMFGCGIKGMYCTVGLGAGDRPLPLWANPLPRKTVSARFGSMVTTVSYDSLLVMLSAGKQRSAKKI